MHNDSKHNLLGLVGGRRQTPNREDGEELKVSPWFGWTLIFIMLVGFGLRVTYADHQSFNPDEQIAQAVVKNLDFPHAWDTNWSKSDVTEPFHYDQYNFSSYHYTLYWWKSLLKLAGLSWFGELWVWRALNGMFGVVFLGAIALTARQFAGNMAGIAAAAAGAVIPLLIQDAHYVRCEAMLTAGVAVLLWLSCGPDTKARGKLLTSGLIAGWMLACKATMGLALPLLIPLVLSTADLKFYRWKSIVAFCGLAALGVGLGLIVGMPWGVAQPHLYLSGLARLAEQYRSPMPPYTNPEMSPSYFVTWAYMVGTMGWGFWAFTIAGLFGLRQEVRWWRKILLVFPLVAAWIVFGSNSFFAERSFSPFLPIVLVFFGAGCQLLVDGVSRHRFALQRYRVAALVFLLALTLALPAIYSWQIVFRGFSGKDQLGQIAFLTQMEGELIGEAMNITGSTFNAQDGLNIEKRTKNKLPVLVVVYDHYDSVTPLSLAVLRDRHNGRILGVRESLFPDLPPCTLHTFISARLWVLYIPAK